MPIFFIPARGRKLTMLVGELDLRDDFLYPREGTETTVFFCCRASARIFFIPARGRKLCGIEHFSYPYEIFFIPARGRKQTASANYPIATDFLHPREGPPFPTKIDIFAIHLFTNSA